MPTGIHINQQIATVHGTCIDSILRITDDALNEALAHYLGDLRKWSPHWQHIEQAQSEAIAAHRQILEHIAQHTADLIACWTYEALTDDAQVAPQVLLAALEAERIAGQADHGEAFPAEVAL